jgi:hypothetical protein
MKNFIATCALLTVGTMVSFAQTNQVTPTSNTQGAPVRNAAAPNTMAASRPTPQQWAQRVANAHKMQYQLDEKQYDKAYAAELEYFTTMEDMRKNQTPPQRDVMEKAMATRDEKLKATMTKEQYAKYENSQPKMRPAAGPNGAPAPVAPKN